MSPALTVFALLGLALLVSACDSTQDKADRLSKDGGEAFTQEGLQVTRRNPDVEVVSTAVLQDANGGAAVVTMRNRSKRGMVRVPVAIDVRGTGRESVFRNDAPGLEPSLVEAPLVPPGGEFTWVNDQVVAAERPRAVKARIGPARGAAPARPPRIVVSRPRLESDSVSGVAAVGKVMNRSKVEQRKLVIYAVARRGGRVVAAGRGQIMRVKAGRRAGYRIFFIGNPKGARLSLEAPPTVLN